MPQPDRRFREKGLVAKDTEKTGMGLFALAHFAPGEPIIQLRIFDDERIRMIRWRDNFTTCEELGITPVPGFFMCPLEDLPFRYLNHSCNANAGLINFGRFEDNSAMLPIVAHRDIAPGDQVCIDYAPFTAPYEGSLQGDPWVMGKCLCGEPNCRGMVTGLDALPQDQQLKFLLPDGQFEGKAFAHVVRDNPNLALKLRDYPQTYDHYLDALEQQLQISERLEKIFAARGE
jgi:hypothetical protein